MADIELVINISEDSYKALCNGWMLPSDVENVVQGIKKSKVLPKGHGDLVDRRKLINDGIDKGFCDWYNEIKNAEVLIEADKEKE